MKKYVSYTEKQIFNDEPHTLLFNMIADCINSASDHRIIVELGDKRGDRYFMIDFQDKAKSNTEYIGDEGTCCWISYMSDSDDDVEEMFCGGYTNLLSVLDTITTIADRGFTEIYTECY